LTLNTTGGASVLVDGVTAANSQNVTGPLTINAPGGTAGFVTAASSFNSLVVNADSIDLNANVNTASSAGQTYNGAVTLSAPVTLAANGGGGVLFSSTVDGGTTLNVDAGGAAIFDGAVGGNQALAGLTVVAPVIDLNGGPITTTGPQTFIGAVTLTASATPATLTSTQGGNITFVSSVDGAQTLDVETSGTTTFGGAVGANVALASLMVDAHDGSGVIVLSGGSVSTHGSQIYDTANLMTLVQDTTLTTGTTLKLGMGASSGYPFVLNGNGHSLTLINGGPAVVNGTIIDVSSFYASTPAPLAYGNLTLEGNITTTPFGSITILEDTTFPKSTTLTFDTLTLGQKNPALEAEFYGPGPIIFDNTGEANLVYGSLNSIQSILFENPQLAFLPGVPESSVQIPITELLEAEGTAIRSAFDLAKKTIVKPQAIEMEVDMRSPSVARSILLRSGQLYKGENISPTP
jgi:hypothetical protein